MSTSVIGSVDIVHLGATPKESFMFLRFVTCESSTARRWKMIRGVGPPCLTHRSNRLAVCLNIQQHLVSIRVQTDKILYFRGYTKASQTSKNMTVLKGS